MEMSVSENFFSDSEWLYVQNKTWSFLRQDVFFINVLHAFLMEQRLTYLVKSGGSCIKYSDVKY